MEIPVLEIELCEENEYSFAEEYVRELRPDWDGRSLILKKLYKGHLNTNLLCYPSDNPPTQGIVFRTSNPFFCGPISPIHETVKFMTKNGLGAKVSALFRNGYCMKYIHGESLDWRSPRLYDKELWSKVAEKLAFWHSRKISEHAIREDIRFVGVLSEECARNYDLALASRAFRDHRNSLPTSEQILDAENLIVESMKSAGDLDIVFCHMDMNHSNFIVNEEGLEFVDYDFSGQSFLQRDIAWFFRSFENLTDPTGQIPGEKYEMDFLIHYLQHRKTLDSDSESSVTEFEVRKLFSQVEKAKLLVDLRLVVITVMLHYVYGGEGQMIKTCEDFYWGKLEERLDKFGLRSERDEAG